MPIRVAPLKIDFKIDSRGIVRILDIGDGLSCDVGGFEDKAPAPQMLSDMHEATGAKLASIFGELPFAAMHSKSMHIPLVLRQPASLGTSLSTDDLPSTDSIIPCAHVGFIASDISYAWGKEKENIMSAPIGLYAGVEHKILWYFLMQKWMNPKEQPAILYWNNSTNPNDIDLNAINLKHGCFIKIADCSEGGGSNVYYAKDKKELLTITKQLYDQYNASNEKFRNHLYVIEPAYITLKPYKGKEYNVTGRAFITLVYDTSTKKLNVKIAAAKWMFPLTAFEDNRTQDQMLANIKHSSKWQNLNADELTILASNLVNTYSEVFKAAFTNDDLIAYFADHPYMDQFIACLKPRAVYTMHLNTFYQAKQLFDKNSLLNTLIAQRTAGNHIGQINYLLDNLLISGRLFKFFQTHPEGIMQVICSLSFIENFVAHYKKVNNAELFTMFPFLPTLIAKEALIKSTLNHLIMRYLDLKNYDKSDFNKALRQAANLSDIATMKILIYTYRVNVNALSPSNKSALDYALISTNEKDRELAIRLLTDAGAQKQPEVLASNVANLKI